MELHNIQEDQFMSTDSYIFIFLKKKKSIYPTTYVYSYAFGPVVEIYLFLKYKMGPHTFLFQRELDPGLCLHQAAEISKACDVSWQLILSKGFSRVQFLVSCFLL